MENNMSKDNIPNHWMLEIAPISAKLALVSSACMDTSNLRKNAVDINRFIQNIVCSISTPCDEVLSLITVLYEAEEDLAKKEYLATIVHCATKLVNYSNNMTDFLKSSAKLLPIVFKKINLQILVNHIITGAQPAAQQKGLNLAAIFQNDIAKIVIGDNYRLQIILEQLVSNGIKFTEQGNVIVTVNTFAATMRAQDQQDNKEVILQLIIHDTGRGISKDQKQYIYAEFTKLDYASEHKGLGLGLAVVKQFIQDLHGEIDVSSEEGKGTTFVCNIPVKLPLLNGFIYDAN